MAPDYFVSDVAWDAILSHSQFDYIVVGSGFTALAFIQQALLLDSHARILCLERGHFWLPVHFQNIPPPFKVAFGGDSEIFPWTLTPSSYDSPVRFMHGYYPYFGGRSTFWSAWSPRPRKEDLRHFPKSMIETASKEEFWKCATTLANVKSAGEINDGIFGDLQMAIDTRMKSHYMDIKFATYTESAQLSVGSNSPTSTIKFNKFSVPGKLLDLFERQRKLVVQSKGSPLEIALNCVVSKLGKPDQNGYVRSMDTSRGTLAFGKNTKVILCAGVIPNTTLLLNSFPMVRKTAGKRLTGHFLSHITARCPLAKYRRVTEDKLQIAAHYLAGEADRQFHVQITAIHSLNPALDAEDLARECPDYAAAATFEQLKDSTCHVVFVCATVGELDETNEHSFVHLNDGQDRTCNIDLQVTLTKADKKLWDDMDQATLDTIAVLSDVHPDSDLSKSEIEYWNEKTKRWEYEKPGRDTTRVFGVVHEASTLRIDEDAIIGPVNEKYKVHGINERGHKKVIENVYVTGGAIFPTSGSWNPTLTMCGFAQDLAKKLYANPASK